MDISNENISILFRLQKYSDLIRSWDNNEITFSCAANWLNYYVKTGNKSIGDFRECAFSCSKDKESAEKRLGLLEKYSNNILPITNIKDGYFLVYIPVLLIPCLCFYSVSHNTNKFQDNQVYSFNLEMYKNNMMPNDDAGILIIHNIKDFFNELNNQLKELRSNLTSNIELRNSKYLYFSNHVKYINWKETGIVNFKTVEKLLFLKDVSYKHQAEFRVALTGFRFSNDYTENFYEKLTIKLPHLKKYSQIYSIKDKNTLFLKKNDKHIEIYIEKR